MRTRARHAATLGLGAALAAFALLCAQALAASTVSPLPPSAYTVHSACPPPLPGHASCLALELVGRTVAARAHTHPLGVARAAAQRSSSPVEEGDFGLRPQDLHTAYQLPLDTASSPTQTIALVDAYNDPSAEADLASYSQAFGLPKCTAANGCFEQVNQNGSAQAANLPFPQSQGFLDAEDALCEGSEAGESARKREEREEACYEVEEAEGWGLEISLDIETAHAICQNCDIALVEADSASYSDLETAEETAVRLGAGEVSNSWAGSECYGGACERESPAFNHPGVVITVAAGDDGYLNWLEEPRLAFAEFPASSPQVVAVGGTRLSLDAQSRRTGETVWNDGGSSGGYKDGHGAGGGGCSTQFIAEPWQQNAADWPSVGCGEKRAVADVAADADPYTGLAVYDTSPECETAYEEEDGGGEIEQVAHWCTIGGTSLASPLIASVFALAGGADGVQYPAQTLYRNAAKSPGSLYDVTSGSNGECPSPFDEETGLTACTPGQEAEKACGSQPICLAGTGYDGPTGVGTPNGIAAFQPPAGGWGEEASSASDEGPGPGSGSGSEGAKPGGASGSTTTVLTSSRGSSATTASPPVEVSGLALTLKALIALNTSRPKIPDLAFTFTVNVAARVRVTLGKRVRRGGHERWQPLAHALTIVAVRGHNSRRLSGHGVLSAGTYRLTLAPVHGTPRSIVFRIG